MSLSTELETELSHAGLSDTQRESFARVAVRGMDAATVVAPAKLVNRTHRVVRERARMIQERRTRVRSMTLPLLLCSILLALTALAIWFGVNQEAVEADLAGATGDAGNRFLVILLWFVPVSIAILGAVMYRHSAGNEDDGVR